MKDQTQVPRFDRLRDVSLDRELPLCELCGVSDQRFETFDTVCVYRFLFSIRNSIETNCLPSVVQTIERPHSRVFRI